MIDYGLLVSMIIAFGLPALVDTWWTVSGSDGPIGFLDVALGPAFAGLAVGRLVTLALDDPSSIGSVPDMLIIRSGVEFWPGLAAAVAVTIVAAKMYLVPLSKRLSEFAPLAMLGYAGFEAACVFRDGCFGPDSPIGLRAPGLSSTMLPIGWFMALAVAVAAVGVHKLVARQTPAIVALSVATLAVASVRAIGSIWLPHVGDGLTRQHLTSIAVAAAAAIATLVVATTSRHSATPLRHLTPRRPSV